MRKIGWVIMALFLLLPAPVITARQVEDCPDAAVQAWTEVAVRVMGDYDLVANEEDGLSKVATIQQLRRDMEAIGEPPACLKDTHDSIISMLNLSADAVVAVLVEDSDLADTLLNSADTQKEQAVEGVESLTGGGEGNAVVLTEPTDGAVVQQQVIVRGTYDPALLGENDIWVFVVPNNFRYYPQILDGCVETDRRSVAYRGESDWAINIGLGEPDSNFGEPFEIWIMMGDAEATQNIYDMFLNEWCPTENYPGLATIDDLGLVEISHIIVTRATE